MKILLVNRGNLLSKFGGDSIKTLKTKEYLEKKGIRVDLILGKQNISLSSYTLVHIFNLSNIKLTPWWVRKAKKAKKPVVLTTIWWRTENTPRYLYQMYRRYHPRYGPPIQISERILGRDFSQKVFNKAYRLRFFNKEKYSIENADWLIAESYSEAREIASYFNQQGVLKKISVVPNGINKEVFETRDNQRNLVKEIPPDFVLTIGRIDPVKNQLNIIRALFNEKRIPLVFIGSKAGPLSYKNYIEEFEKKAAERENVYWFDNMPLAELVPFYKKAKVYCQPSLWETFGMAIFEAASFGCNLVISRECGAQDYFKTSALYCNPLNLGSIKASVMSARERPKKRHPLLNLQEELDWERIAAELLDTYKKVLSR